MRLIRIARSEPLTDTDGEVSNDLTGKKRLKMNKLMVSALAAVPMMVFAAGGLYSDRPDDMHAWGMHDPHRPLPPKVTANPGQPPSDAVVLFDGTLKSFKENWCNARGGASRWKFVDGAMESVRKAGNICSKRKFGDVQLHVEWQSPLPVTDHGINRGNSGVFVMDDLYEIQVLDSYETDPKTGRNPTYADGVAGAVYGQNPPLVNATRAPGEWQAYDIIFHRPVFEGDRCVRPGTYTVLLNGVLVQDHWELEGPTWYSRRPKQVKPPEKGSIQLQDHHNPVRFRNIWVREIPSRTANTTHGVYRANKADVAALRTATAARLFAALKNPDAVDLDNVILLAEILGYEAGGVYREKFDAVAAKLVKELDGWPASQVKANGKKIAETIRTLDYTIKAGALPQNCPLRRKLRAIQKR